MAFKMNGWSAFNKNTDKAKAKYERLINKLESMSDEERKLWEKRSNLTLQDLKSGTRIDQGPL